MTRGVLHPQYDIEHRYFWDGLNECGWIAHSYIIAQMFRVVNQGIWEVKTIVRKSYAWSPGICTRHDGGGDPHLTSTTLRVCCAIPEGEEIVWVPPEG